MKITLSRPLQYKDTELTTLDMDLDAMTGRDMLDIEATLRARGENVSTYSQAYFAAVASKAVHLPLEVLKGLPLRDFMSLTNAVMIFFGATVSPDMTDRTSDGQPTI